jgi:hypothetical protein
MSARLATPNIHTVFWNSINPLVQCRTANLISNFILSGVIHNLLQFYDNVLGTHLPIHGVLLGWKVRNLSTKGR